MAHEKAIMSSSVFLILLHLLIPPTVSCYLLILIFPRGEHRDEHVALKRDEHSFQNAEYWSGV